MSTGEYKAMRAMEGPVKRETFVKISWASNFVAIAFGIIQIFCEQGFLAFIIGCCYAINMFVLLGDYERWKRYKEYVMYSMYALMAFDLIYTICSFYARFVKGNDSSFFILCWLWIVFFLEIVLLLSSFLLTYYVYPDELSLLSQEHPASFIIANSVMANRPESDKLNVQESSPVMSDVVKPESSGDSVKVPEAKA